MFVADRAFAVLQHVLPHHLLCRLVHAVARCRCAGVKNTLIHRFAKAFAVDLDEAVTSAPEAYPHFNAFFTRALKPGARPLPAQTDALIAPADGRLCTLGPLTDGTLLQAKGRPYSLAALLAGQEHLTRAYAGGHQATIYLSPRDYHRVHLPCDARIEELWHVPGRLYSVNAATARTIDGVFARNERLICHFTTPAGPMAVILVGALFVGSLESVWTGPISPPRPPWPRMWNLRQRQENMQRGAEIGRFNMGSTVIVLFGPGQVRWRTDLRPGMPIRMGEILATPDT